MTLFWLGLAVWLYIVVWALVTHALRPQTEWHPYPDWFYQGGTWTRSDQPGIVHGQYESFKQEPSDQPASKPESEAG